MLRETKDLIYSPAMSLPEGLIRFLRYYQKVFKQIWNGVWTFSKQQVFVGIITGLMAVILNLQLGLTPKESGWAAVGVVLFPFIAIVVAIFILQAVRAPWLLDKSRQEEISHLNKVALTASGYVQGGQKAIEDKIKREETYKWLLERADSQAKRLHQHAKLQRVVIKDIRLDDPVPFIKFGLDILNTSIFNIGIDEKVEGYIEFRGRRLGEKLLVEYNPDEITPGNNGGLMLEQRLSDKEAKFIADFENAQDANFYFNNLTVIVKGGSQFPLVEPQKLIITKGVHISGNVPVFHT